jgi:crossover junction endodeoxyribonuclease RusA
VCPIKPPLLRCKSCGAETDKLYCEACSEPKRVLKPTLKGVPKGSGFKTRNRVEASARWEGGSLVVTLPLPPRSLSPNSRSHWRVKASAASAYRVMAEVAARTAGPLPCWGGLTMEPVFYWPDGRRRDDDNASASLKNARDGFADAGLVSDDSVIRAMPAAFEVDRERPRVEIILSPIPLGY